MSDDACAVGLGEVDDLDDPVRQLATADLRSEHVELADEETAEDHCSLHDASTNHLVHGAAWRVSGIVEGVEEAGRAGQVAAHLAQEGSTAGVGRVGLGAPLIAHLRK